MRNKRAYTLHNFLVDKKAAGMTESIITPAASVADIRVYGRRWVILALFSLVLMLNSMPWSQYTVLEDVVTEYYGVSSSQVEWTGLVYNVTAMVLVLPAAWFLEKYGVRAAVTVGIVGTTLGLSVRIVGCWPRHFWAVIVGQAIVGASTNFLTSAPTRVAALWFPAKEVSSALAATMIGQTGGVCLGSLLAPLSARGTWTRQDNFWGFLTLNGSMAVAGFLLLLAILFFFQKAPPHPPSSSQASAQVLLQPGEYFKSVRRIMKNGSFLLLLLSFNIIVSVYVAVTTLLNRDVMSYFPDHVSETGVLAMLLTLTGVIATFAFGILLDRTKKFKELSVLSYFGCLVSLALYSATVSLTSMKVLYVAVGIMGAFLASCFVPAYEWAIELTYPEYEGNSASLLNWIVQPCSLITTLAYSRVFSTWGPHAAHGLLVGLTFAGLVAQICIPKRYRRLEAERAIPDTQGIDNPAVDPDTIDCT